MSKFVIKWIDGRTQVVEGSCIAVACCVAGISVGELSLMDSYTEDGKVVQVVGRAPCGCSHHAEEGLACEHDLKRAGLRG